MVSDFSAGGKKSSAVRLLGMREDPGILGTIRSFSRSGYWGFETISASPEAPSAKSSGRILRQ
jgi:hypothetical protein